MKKITKCVTCRTPRECKKSGHCLAVASALGMFKSEAPSGTLAVATGSVSLTYEQLAAMLKQCKSNVQSCPAEAPAGYYALDDQEIKVADACWHSGMDQLENEILNWAFDELRASRNSWLRQ